MRLAISNIAWDPAEDAAVLDILHAHAVDAIDVAPGKYFPDPARATDAEIGAVRRWWSDRGVEITGMQALLFGTTGLNVFAPREVQDAMLAHLAHVCRIAAGLHGPRLVFGSPKNRDRSGLSDAEALDRAVAFFRRVGDAARQEGVTMCLEPNPERYGANFMTTAAETAKVVRAVAHPAIRMQLDTGALTITGEAADAVVAHQADIIGHVHASEPDLLPLGDGGTDHVAVARTLHRHLPHHVISIEMLATRNEPHAQAITRALAHAVAVYRSRPEDAR